MRGLVSALCLAAGLALCQPALTPPQLGWVRDTRNGLRPVLGLAANFILGDTLHEGVVSSAFSGSFGVVKTDAAIMVLDRDGRVLFRAYAEAGPALFAFSNDGQPAFVYLPQSQALVSWKADEFEPAPFDPAVLSGTVRAIASPAPDRVTAVVKRDDGLWMIDLAMGTQALVPGVDGPVLLRNDGALLYTGSQGLMLRQADQTEQCIEGSVAPAVFEQMGRDWVHIIERDSSRHFAVRLEPGREQMYQLPEIQQ